VQLVVEQGLDLAGNKLGDGQALHWFVSAGCV
jgi:hypothetical protein